MIIPGMVSLAHVIREQCRLQHLQRPTQAALEGPRREYGFDLPGSLRLPLLKQQRPRLQAIRHIRDILFIDLCMCAWQNLLCPKLSSHPVCTGEGMVACCTMEVNFVDCYSAGVWGLTGDHVWDDVFVKGDTNLRCLLRLHYG